MKNIVEVAEIILPKEHNSESLLINKSLCALELSILIYSLEIHECDELICEGVWSVEGQHE